MAAARSNATSSPPRGDPRYPQTSVAGPQALPAVQSVLIERHAHQRLDAAQVDGAFLPQVLVVERPALALQRMDSSARLAA